MKPDTRSFYAAAVQRTIEFIITHLDEALDLESLAGAACLSPFHFHRVFRGMTGETPLELTRRLRLERAASQLASTERAVTAIAFDAGFDAHESFTRAFRQHYGVSPSGFRERRHQRISLVATCGIHFDPSARGGEVPLFVPRDTGGQHMDVIVKDVPGLRLATVRHLGPYNQIPVAFEELGRRLGPSAGRLFAAGAAMIALYHDDPEAVPLDQLRSDAAVSLPAGEPCPPDLIEQAIPAGRYASTVHVGAYEQLGDTWARFLGEWLPSSGHRIAGGPSFERYLNNPQNTAKPNLRTEILVPVG